MRVHAQTKRAAPRPLPRKRANVAALPRVRSPISKPARPRGGPALRSTPARCDTAAGKSHASLQPPDHPPLQAAQLGPLEELLLSLLSVRLCFPPQSVLSCLPPSSAPRVPGAAKPRRSPRTPAAPAAAAPSAASPAPPSPTTLREGAQRASNGARASARRRSATASPPAAAALPASPSPDTRARTPAGRGARAPCTARARTPSRTPGAADPAADADACHVPAPRSVAPAPSPARAPGAADADREAGATSEDEAALAALGALPLGEREAGIAAARRFINRRVSDPVRRMHAC